MKCEPIKQWHIMRRLIKLLRDDPSGFEAVEYLQTLDLPEKDKDYLFRRADERAYPSLARLEEVKD